MNQLTLALHSNPPSTQALPPSEPALSFSGRWSPLPKTLHASVSYPFFPLYLDPTKLDFKGKTRLHASDTDPSSSQDLTEKPSSWVPANPHQVPLSIGDECYVFEQYLPALHPVDPSTIWYRGYVVTVSHQPSSLTHRPIPQLNPSDSQPFGLSDEPDQSHDAAYLSDEPQVLLGIFPASHIQIRESPDDTSHRSSSTFPHSRPNSSTQPQRQHPPFSSQSQNAHLTRSYSKESGPMEPLPEEDESDFLTTSVLSLIPPNHSSLQDLTQETQTAKLSTPLPSLKAGDETSAGRDEPLVDETACALRDWYTWLFVHLHRRRYRLFHIMKDQIEALHMGRRQLLAQTLSTEEAAKLRRDLVNRLVFGNYIQGFDIIVRHPDYGALVDTEVEIEAVDSRSWMSIIRMYVCQVKLAYLSPTLNSPSGAQAIFHPNDSSASNALSSINSSNNSKLSEPNQIPLNAHLPSLRNTRTDGPTSADMLASPHVNRAQTFPGSNYRPKFHHILLEIKSFCATPCAEGELIELYFSLYNKNESRFLTEEFCVILNHLGLPHRSIPSQSTRLPDQNQANKIGLNGNLLSIRTLFKDISPQDVQDSIFLVCRLVKNGAMKSIASQPPASMSSMPGLQENTQTIVGLSTSSAYDSDFNPHGNSFDGAPPDPPPNRQFTQPNAQGEYDGMTFTNPRLGIQSVRRPCGCAVVELGQFSSQTSHLLISNSAVSPLMPTTVSSLTTTGVFEPPTTRYTMNIFSPVSEPSFPTLHEDIIASRTKEFFGSGNLTSNHNAPGNGMLNGHKHQHPTLHGPGPKNESIEIEMKTYYGDTPTILKENSSTLSDVPLTSRLGFPDVVYPDDSRNEIYIKLWSGDFSNLNVGASKMISASGSGKNIQVSAELRTKTGQVLERVISRGSGEPKVTRYTSMVYPWGELMKLDIGSETIEISHLFFTFRNRPEKSSRNQNDPSQAEKPFAFAYLPLFSVNLTFIPDGEHNLVLFKYDKQSATPEVYSRARPTVVPGQATPEITPALSKLLIPLKDSFIVRSFLCSTVLTQDVVLLKLMKWEALLDDPAGLRQTLTELKFASEVEICKFLRNIFDALFGVLVSRANSEAKDYDELVFNALVTLLGIVSDRRFTNFKPVVDLYIDHHFSSTAASTHLLRSFQNLLANPTSPENAHPLRCSIKVWGYLMRFIVRSRELQRIKELNAPSSGLMSDAIESKFKADMSFLLSRINTLMVADSNSVIGTQTLAVQHFPSLMTELAKVFSPLELLEKINLFLDPIKVTKGKIVMWKLLLQEHIVMSPIFDQAEGRAQLVPKLTTWVKPHLGEFEDYLMFKPQDNDTVKHSARVTWLESTRIAVAVIAVALDKFQEILIDPSICSDTAAVAQEHDNVEYLLGLLPKLLESFREFENPANVEVIQRMGTTASVISPVPIVFPATYPFSLLNSLPQKPNLSLVDPIANHDDPNSLNNNPSTVLQNNPPTVQNALGEIAVVMITMIMLAPTRMLNNYLELMLEVEGKLNFGRFLSKLFKAFYSILKNKAFPSNWLNINVVSHKAVLKLISVVSTILQREFVPTGPNQMLKRKLGDSAKEEKSYTDEEQFDSNLWSDFFVLNHGLLSSRQLAIEEYPPQKRRAIWKLAGDIRAEGSKIFRSAWESIGDFTISIGGHLVNNHDLNRNSSVSTHDLKDASKPLNQTDSHDITKPQFNEVTRCGGYQVQFVPGFIEPLLELCLSHHDELRSNAVIVFYSVIVSEFNLNRDFTVIADEIIDKLDNLLGNLPSEKPNSNVDEMSKARFVTQLKILFEETPLIDKPLPIGDSGRTTGSDEHQGGGIEPELKAQVEVFLESLTQFLELLLSIRNLPPGDEFIDDRVIGTLKLMSFIRNIGRSGIYIHYVHKLVNFHAAHGNFVEAGLALRLHADLHEWDLNGLVDAMPELSLPRQTAFARKETLYLRILDFLAKGKAWESGIQICKELQEQYEHVSFDYARLSEVLAHQSSLYFKIVKTERYFSEYFRVAFYGQGFPPSVQNRQFVYRGYEWEKYGAFCDRMHNKHSNAQIIQSHAVSTDELAYAEGQYLQITRVVAEPDRTTVLFKNPEVASSIISYYEHNATNTFSHSKPFNKDNVDPDDTVRMWVEKTFLVCEDAFPTVLKRSEILEIRVLEISPIENAIMITEQKTRELESLHRRYLALTKTSDAKLNTNPLSMALNGIVDAPAKTGIPAFRNAFLVPHYLEKHPNQIQSVNMLRQAIDHQTIVIDASLRLHQLLCPPEMKTFHATLHKFFLKNFTEEISRLPLSPSLLNPENPAVRAEGFGRNKDGLIRPSSQNAEYSISSSNSLPRPSDTLAPNPNYQPYDSSSGQSLSLSLQGLSPTISNNHGHYQPDPTSVGIGASPLSQVQSHQAFDFTSSPSFSSQIQTMIPSAGFTSNNNRRQSTLTGNPSSQDKLNQTGGSYNTNHIGSPWVDLSHDNSNGKEISALEQNAIHEKSLIRSSTGHIIGITDFPDHNIQFGDGRSGSSTLGGGNGSVGGGGGQGSSSSSSNGFGKLIRKGTGTILSHNSGSSRNSSVGPSPAAAPHRSNPIRSLANLNINSINHNNNNDRKSILGIRFGSRHK